MKRTVFLLVISSCFWISSEAQLLKKILDKTTDKVIDGAANMAAEKVSDAIARKILSSLDQTFDEYIDQVIKEDSLYKSKYGDSLSYSDIASKWAGSLNRAADLPPEYSFDITLLTESTYKKDVTMMEMYFQTDAAMMGFKQEENDGIRYMVFDMENDVTSLYFIDKKGNKTAQALPNLFNIGAAIASSEQYQNENENISCERTGKVETFAGYKSKELKCEDEEYTYSTYFSEEVGIDWRQSYIAIFEKYASTQYNENMEMANGMFMASFTNSKKGKKKDEASWEVKEVRKIPFSITNADYTFTGIDSE